MNNFIKSINDKLSSRTEDPHRVNIICNYLDVEKEFKLKKIGTGLDCTVYSSDDIDLFCSLYSKK